MTTLATAALVCTLDMKLSQSAISSKKAIDPVWQAVRRENGGGKRSSRIKKGCDMVKWPL